MQAVVVSLCLETEATAALGLGQHVCELQLVPAPFAAILVPNFPSTDIKFSF